MQKNTFCKFKQKQSFLEFICTQILQKPKKKPYLTNPKIYVIMVLMIIER